MWQYLVECSLFCCLVVGLGLRLGLGLDLVPAWFVVMHFDPEEPKWTLTYGWRRRWQHYKYRRGYYYYYYYKPTGWAKQSKPPQAVLIRRYRVITSYIRFNVNNGVDHVNKANLRRARLVLGLVTTSGWYIASRYLCRLTQPGNPSVHKCSECCWWYRPGHRWGRNGESCVVVGGPATRTAGILAEVG